MKNYMVSLFVTCEDSGYVQKNFCIESCYDVETLANNIQTEIEAIASMRSVTIVRAEKPKCNCDRRDLMTYGCKCGGV